VFIFLAQTWQNVEALAVAFAEDLGEEEGVVDAEVAEEARRKLLGSP